jgi:hypothetical protein
MAISSPCDAYEALVYQLTELHPTRYASDIRDQFESANTRELGTSPVDDFPGGYAVKPYHDPYACWSMMHDSNDVQF